jgi:2-polyprenyl-3-methyl-5-hydroxy-6-metoxy-1,4-benzoquinol methylase
VKPGARVLDFGAGNGFKTAVAAVLGYECSAYDDLQDAWAEGDEGRKFVEALAARFNLNYVVADSSLWPFANEYFDIVMMHDVLEHLHDSPKPIMNQLLNSTKVGGHVFVTVPNLVNIRKRLDVLRGRTNLEKFEAYYHHPGQWRGHVREYTRQDLELLAKLLGTELVELRGVHHMLQKVPRGFLNLYKGLMTLMPDMADTWMMVARKPSGWTPNGDLSKEELFRVLSSV